jgi:hypothetical protein
VNYTGNHTKSLHVSAHDSLKKLRTSYIDILYVHWWDYNTSVEEVMNSLHILVLQGEVLYLVCLLPYDSLDLPFWLIPLLGSLGCSGVGSCESEPVREISRKDAFCGLSRPVECLRTLL